jgi:hypothetical protein
MIFVIIYSVIFIKTGVKITHVVKTKVNLIKFVDYGT